MAKPAAPVDVGLPTPPGKPGGWGEKLENTLIRVLARLLNTAKELLADILRFGFELFLEAIEPNYLDITRPIFELLEGRENMPPQLREYILSIRSGEHQVGAALLNAVGGQAVGSITGSVINSLLAPLTYELNRLITPARLAYPVARAARLRDRGKAWLAVSDMLDQGWDNERLAMMDTASETRPGVSDLLTLWLRGYLSEADLDARLVQEGVGPGFVSEVKRLAEALPGPADLVRFALREAWDDSVADRYGYDEGYNPQFGDEMARQGFDPQWSKLFWRSHWDLPSVSAGYEMLHRGIITREDLERLLTVADIPRFWREALIAISYAPYTRVDVRRMYQMGILSEDQVLQAYRDIGYPEDRAAALTRFAVAGATEEERALTKADILGAYRSGMIDRSEATDMLIVIGYTADGAGFLLGREDFARAQALNDKEVGLVRLLYLQGDISREEVYTRLATLAVPTRQIAIYLESWDIDKRGKTKRPTLTQLRDFLSKGIITIEEFTRQLSAMGYQDQYLSWFVASEALEAQERAEKEERAARQEQERLAKQVQVSDYQAAKAAIDVDIAELRAAIAAANVALVELEAERAQRLAQALPVQAIADLQAEYLPVIREAEAEIAEATVRAADLRRQAAEIATQRATIRQSLAQNVDVAARQELEAERGTILVEQSRYDERIAANRTQIARLKEQALTLRVSEAIEANKAAIAALEVEIREWQEVKVALSTRLREIDAEMQEALNPERRQGLVAEDRTLSREQTILSATEREIGVAIAEARQARDDAQRELDAEIARLPGKPEAARIEAEYQAKMDEVNIQIARYRANIAELQQQKALLTVGYRLAV